MHQQPIFTLQHNQWYQPTSPVNATCLVQKRNKSWGSMYLYLQDKTMWMLKEILLCRTWAGLDDPLRSPSAPVFAVFPGEQNVPFCVYVGHIKVCQMFQCILISQ